MHLISDYSDCTVYVYIWSQGRQVYRRFQRYVLFSIGHGLECRDSSKHIFRDLVIV